MDLVELLLHVGVGGADAVCRHVLIDDGALHEPAEDFFRRSAVIDAAIEGRFRQRLAVDGENGIAVTATDERAECYGENEQRGRWRDRNAHPPVYVDRGLRTPAS